MASGHILVVDDEPDIRGLVQDILQDEGYQVSVAENAAAARELRRQIRPDAILLDIWMPDTDGISLLREWSERGGLGCPVIMISGHGTVETAVEATRLGAYDFVEKPLSLAKLLLTVERALEASRLKRENEGLKRQVPVPLEPVGSSRVMQALRGQLERIAGHDTWLLLSGEAGSGKESLARWLHEKSARRSDGFDIDYGLSLREAREQFERVYLLRQLQETGGSVGKLAKLVGMERTHLYRKLRDLGVDVKAGSRED